MKVFLIDKEKENVWVEKSTFFHKTEYHNPIVLPMWSSAIRLSSKAIKPQIIAPVRTIMTCTNPPSLNNRRQGYAPMVYQQKRTFMGPVIRIVTQFLASLGGTSIRAFFQAFQQAAGILFIFGFNVSSPGRCR